MTIREEYDRIFETTPIRGEPREYEWFAKILFKEKPKELPSITTLLDVGCGGGYFLKKVARGKIPHCGYYRKHFWSRFELYKYVEFVTGIDISEEAIKIAIKECPDAAFFVGSAEDLKYPINCSSDNWDEYGNFKPYRFILPEKFPFLMNHNNYDAVTCLGSLEHFQDIPKSLSEMRQIAAPNAFFMILVPNLYWYKDILSAWLTGDRKPRNQTHEKFASLKEWKTILENSGMIVKKIIKYNGIAKNPIKQWLKDLLIPRNLSYHFLFICR